jgi:hypothetical protein
MGRHIAPKTFRTKGDAQAWLAEERRLISQQRWSSPSERAAQAAAIEAHRRERTFAVYAEQWLATRVTSKGEGLRPTTRAGYRNSLDVHILPRFGSLPLDEITRAAVRSWRGQFSAAGHDAAEAEAYSLLKAILQTAGDDELIQLNPADSKELGMPRRTGSPSRSPHMNWRNSLTPCLRGGAPSPWSPAGAAYGSPSRPACDAPTYSAPGNARFQRSGMPSGGTSHRVCAARHPVGSLLGSRHSGPLRRERRREEGADGQPRQAR